MHTHVNTHGWRVMHQLATATSTEPSPYCATASQYYSSTSDEQVSLTDIPAGYGDVESLVAPLDLCELFWYVELSAESRAATPSAIFTVTYNLSTTIKIRQHVRFIEDRMYIKLGVGFNYHL